MGFLCNLFGIMGAPPPKIPRQFWSIIKIRNLLYDQCRKGQNFQQNKYLVKISNNRVVIGSVPRLVPGTRLNPGRIAVQKQTTRYPPGAKKKNKKPARITKFCPGLGRCTALFVPHSICVSLVHQKFIFTLISECVIPVAYTSRIEHLCTRYLYDIFLTGLTTFLYFFLVG